LPQCCHAELSARCGAPIGKPVSGRKTPGRFPAMRRSGQAGPAIGWVTASSPTCRRRSRFAPVGVARRVMRLFSLTTGHGYLRLQKHGDNVHRARPRDNHSSLMAVFCRGVKLSWPCDFRGPVQQNRDHLVGEGRHPVITIHHPAVTKVPRHGKQFFAGRRRRHCLGRGSTASCCGGLAAGRHYLRP